jgi:pyruvate,water dikinase
VAIISLDSANITLEVAGGKGANLARLLKAGLRVPRGFIVTTAEYHSFVEDNSLREKIRAAAFGLSADNAEAVEGASQKIRAAFLAGRVRPKTEAAIRGVCTELGNSPVAVRSSATSEDLPDLSFAGQQDTYLNVCGADDVLTSIIRCWSSLWTARAIGYRLRNAISGPEIALAVVIQEMVESESSGVLFTVNPLTGLRTESVIDATFGLGESLVSGQVEPDHYVVESHSGRILEKELGAKNILIRGKSGGGTETIATDTAQTQALPDDQIRRVVELGRQIQQEFGAPQDIEWAFHNGTLNLLQSRPITSLYPLPSESFDPLKVWFSFGAVQGLLGPMTPLGLDSVRLVVAGAGRLFGLKLEFEKLDLFAIAGERLWIRIDGVMRNPIGARVYKNLLPMVEPSVGRILKTLASDPRMDVGEGKLRLSTVWRLARFALSLLPSIVRTVREPEKAATATYRSLEYFTNQAGFSGIGDSYERLTECVSFLRDRSVVRAFELIMPRFLPMMAPSMGALGLLTRLAGSSDAGDHGISPLVLEITRGLPHNVTTEMDLALWETAKAVRSDAASCDRFQSASPAGLARAYTDRSLPPAAQAALDDFMGRYGMRGVGEIDLGMPRWREQPEPIMQTLQSYLQITDENFAPDVVFERGVEAAEAAIEQLSSSARRQRGGWLKERLVRAAARRVRALLGIREAPKFFAIRVMGVSREEILAIGRGLVAGGVIERPDDLFFLYISELDSLSKKEQRDWKALIASHRRAFEREARRRQVPRVLVSDGRTFYEGLGAELDTGGVLTGSPVSPGVVEGIVHVVSDPHQSQLAPGEILVCPGTDPAWTPLFMAAGGLITEVGGMMTHGSVVAREFGIPAVVGVDRATTRLKDGQKIRLDGATGRIILL